MTTIKAIEGRTVHQIQSGQVIVDLCSVVKELVENGLDAGATSIEVRFKNQGLESIEVQDNGDGISPQNYETLALKHHTSKLSTYSDLTTLQTFGFRGEALSSLCALSRFSVVTCMAADAPKGTKLEFEISGKLKGQSVVAAQKGTTVCVENLFNNLPVRRRELERNIKREWNRVVGVLGQYACIQTRIKFSVTQQAGKGKKTTLFSTRGNQSTRENIVNVFGAKTLTALVPLDLNLELESTNDPSQRWNTQEDGGTKEIRITGHISRPAFGEGRQTPDRQMFFVNSRPCGLPQVAKAFNEVYKSYNASQSPFIFANIELDTHLYDVNVSPDKRTILLHDQIKMLESLKEALTELFESQNYTVPISQLPTQKQPTYKQLTIGRENTIASAAKSPTPGSVHEKSESAEISDTEGEAASQEVNPDNDGERTHHIPQNQRTTLSRASMVKASEPASLISRWAEKMTEQRGESKVETSKSAPPVPAGGLSKDKRILIEKLSKEGDIALDIDEGPDTLANSVTTTQNEPTSSFHPPQRVADFNERMAELQRLNDAINKNVEYEEEPIPAIPPPIRSPRSIADQFSASVRTQRPPADIATITIDGETITRAIGTPSPKKNMHDMALTSVTKKEQPKGNNTTLPSFGSLLSQRFSAPGSTQTPSVNSSTRRDALEVEDGDEGGALDVQYAPHTSELQDTSMLSVEDDTAVEISNLHSEDQINEEVNEESESSLHTPGPIENLDRDRDSSDEVESDKDYMDGSEEKLREEARVRQVIEAAEQSAHVASQDNLLRAKSLLRGTKKKDSTIDLVRVVNTGMDEIREQMRSLQVAVSAYSRSEKTLSTEDEGLDSEKAEDKLSLTISKTDFPRMRVIGQFNLGFILATRASGLFNEDGSVSADDLFIIDQHASDEKYNFERLQATTIVQSQRLVYPKTLDLTALEEEIVLENLPALETNGFILTVDESGQSPVGNRCQVVSLPLSRETTFSLEDLDELLALLADNPPSTIPRPSKVRKMFAMRACRSSIMIGRTLTHKQMSKVVRNLGELDKPWNCPHGRPTMRHLCGLGVWDELGWKEGMGDDGEESSATEWAEYIKKNKALSVSEEEEEDEERFHE